MVKKFVNTNNAREGEYKRVIKEIAKTGKCPFCPENFKYHKKPIYKKKNGWFLTNNSWPYKGAKNHLLILGDKHKENISELTAKDLESVLFLASFAVEKWKIKGGAIAMRFGDSNYTGASVSHIHFHIICPKKNGSVNFPIG